MPKGNNPQFITPPDPMTQPCFRFFKEHRSLKNLLPFIFSVIETPYAIEQAIKDGFLRDSEDFEKMKDLTLAGKPGQVFLGMTWASAVNNFLTYISELMTLLFTTRPETLKSKETVAVEAILEYKDDMDGFISHIAEAKVNQLSYKGMRDLADYFSERFGFLLFKKEEDLDDAVFYVEMRNLIVHNRAVVSRLCTTRIPRLAGQEGTQVVFDRHHIEELTDFLAKSVADIDIRAAQKWNLPQEASPKGLP